MVAIIVITMVVVGILRFYGPLLLAAILLRYGIRKFRKDRKDRYGWLLLALAALPPVLILAPIIHLSIAPALREAETARWPRVEPPVPRPRTLVIETHPGIQQYSDDAALRLAESGLFDVFVTHSQDFPLPNRPLHSKIEVAGWDDCSERRTNKNDFVINAAFTSCGRLVPVPEVPGYGLVLYVGSTAPLAAEPAGGNMTMLFWQYQLGLRSEAGEALISYEEKIVYPKYELNPLTGPIPTKGEYPRKFMNGGLARDSKDLDGFVLRSLGIDPTKIVAPSKQPPHILAARLEPWIASGVRESVVKALLEISIYSETSPELAALVERMFADPRVFKKLWIPQTCAVHEGLARYRDAIIDGCAAHQSTEARKCGDLGFISTWLGNCTDAGTPIWGDSRPPTTRVLVIAPHASYPPSGIIINEEHAGLSTIRIPADRGSVDIVVIASGTVIWKVSGALQCLNRLTVIGVEAAVLGVPEERVEFRYRKFVGNWYTSSGQQRNDGRQLNADLLAQLGAAPDISVIRSNKPDFDLAEFMAPAATSQHSACDAGEAARTLPANGSDTDLPDRIDPHDLLTVPMLIPKQIP